MSAEKIELSRVLAVFLARMAGGVKEMMDVLEFLVARAKEEQAKQ